jgi:transcriptional regulator with XRE-family HTH domain
MSRTSLLVGLDNLYPFGMIKKTAAQKGQYADFVQQVRTAMGWTQERFAEEFGRTKGNVSGWEKNRHNPSFAQMQRMSLLSGIPMPGASEPTASYDVTESAEVKRLIIAFGWLTVEQQRATLADLESKAETNKAISRQLGPRWEFKADHDVAEHIAPAPHTKVKPRKGGPSRNIGDVLGDFQGEE